MTAPTFLAKNEKKKSTLLLGGLGGITAMEVSVVVVVVKQKAKSSIEKLHKPFTIGVQFKPTIMSPFFFFLYLLYAGKISIAF